MTDADQNIPDAPDTTSPVPSSTTTPDPARLPDYTSDPRYRPENPAEIIRTLLAEVQDCERGLLEYRLKAAARYAWARRHLPRAEWRRLFKEKRLPIGIRQVQMLCRIGDNIGLWYERSNQLHFPNSVAALCELAALTPETISRLCGANLITPKMTTRQAKVLVKESLADASAGAIQPTTPTIQPPTLRLI